MARTPHDSVAAFLRKTALPQAVKAEAWDAFQAAESPEDLTPRLKHLPLPQTVRANLWDLKARSRSERETRRNPRRSPYGMGGQMAFRTNVPKEPEAATGAVSAFVAEYFRHFTAARLHDAAEAYKAHIAKGGQMLVSLAGAFSTGELGRCLAPMIRAGKVHAISTTSANLDESVMNLVGNEDYEHFPDFEELTPKDDAALAARGVNRVTDVGLPSRIMKPVEQAFNAQLDRAKEHDERLFPHEVFYRILREETLKKYYQDDPANCWLMAAAEQDLLVVTPGFEDGTIGNVYAAECMAGTYEPSLIKNGTETMMELAKWYREASADHVMGYCQLGGGISGDFAICISPLLALDAGEKDTPLWQYFAQFSSGSPDTYGGYSEAKPTEKRSWLKLPAAAAAFDIQGDYSVNFPILAAIVMGW